MSNDTDNNIEAMQFQPTTPPTKQEAAEAAADLGEVDRVVGDHIEGPSELRRFQGPAQSVQGIRLAEELQRARAAQRGSGEGKPAEPVHRAARPFARAHDQA